jgi:hypothetical protein
LDLRIKKVTDYQDLVGVRVILLFPRDAQKVNELIKEKFHVVKEYDTRERLSPDQFGYTSNHFVVELPQEWLSTPTLQPFKGLRAEIQVRTLSQHLWAEMSHKMQYKDEKNVPIPLKRSISRISALLELVDIQFEQMLEQREHYRDNLTEVGADNTLNRDSLEFTLDGLLPKANKDQSEYYGELLQELTHFGISSTGKLTAFINKHLEDLKKKDLDIVKEKQRTKVLVSVDEKSRIDCGVFLTHTGLVRQALDDEFGIEWRNFVLST